MPSWAAECLTPYKKSDGTTGVEFYGTYRSIDLDRGDELIKHGQRIEFKRKAAKE